MDILRFQMERQRRIPVKHFSHVACKGSVITLPYANGAVSSPFVTPHWLLTQHSKSWGLAFIKLSHDYAKGRVAKRFVI